MEKITINGGEYNQENLMKMDKPYLVSQCLGLKKRIEILEQSLETGQVDAVVMQHKKIKQLAYDAVAFLEQLEGEGEFKFWSDGYNRQVLDGIKEDAKKLGVA